MTTDIEVNVIAWFTAEFVDKKENGIWIREARCRVCGKIISSIVVPETVTDEVRAKARVDGELFLAHLRTAHPDLWGQDDEGWTPGLEN